MTEPGTQGGLFASVRRLLGTATEIAQVRLRLLGNELEQEKLRVFDALLLAGVGLLLLAVGTVLLCGLILLLVTEGYRLAALAVMTIGCIGGAVLLLRAAAGRLRNSGHMFQATLGELAQDHSALAPRE
jgi:uncharacterized membrane protein YqjE